MGKAYLHQPMGGERRKLKNENRAHAR